MKRTIAPNIILPILLLVSIQTQTNVQNILNSVSNTPLILPSNSIQSIFHTIPSVDEVMRTIIEGDTLTLSKLAHNFAVGGSTLPCS